MMKKPIEVCVACRDASGEPSLFQTVVECSEQDYNSGAHYELACQLAAEADYSGPMFAFDEKDALGRLLKRADAALQFAEQVSGLSIWDYEDFNNECGRPDEGFLDSHCALMELIVEARKM